MSSTAMVLHTKDKPGNPFAFPIQVDAAISTPCLARQEPLPVPVADLGVSAPRKAMPVPSPRSSVPS